MTDDEMKINIENLEHWVLMCNRDESVPLSDIKGWLYNLTKVVLHLVNKLTLEDSGK